MKRENCDFNWFKKQILFSILTWWKGSKLTEHDKLEIANELNRKKWEQKSPPFFLKGNEFKLKSQQGRVMNNENFWRRRNCVIKLQIEIKAINMLKNSIFKNKIKNQIYLQFPGTNADQDNVNWQIFFWEMKEQKLIKLYTFKLRGKEIRFWLVVRQCFS